MNVPLTPNSSRQRQHAARVGDDAALVAVPLVEAHLRLEVGHLVPVLDVDRERVQDATVAVARWRNIRARPRRSRPADRCSRTDARRSASVRAQTRSRTFHQPRIAAGCRCRSTRPASKALDGALGQDEASRDRRVREQLQNEECGVERTARESRADQQHREPERRQIAQAPCGTAARGRSARRAGVRCRSHTAAMPRCRAR